MVRGSICGSSIIFDFQAKRGRKRCGYWLGIDYTTTSLVMASNWLVDNAALHHVTGDHQNLATYSPYTGTHSVLIGNGTGLSISRTGSTFLPTSHKNFSLHHTLYVPSMHKNLISVSKFFASNNTSVEIFRDYFHVKDKSTGAILLQGQNNKGIYEWPTHSNNKLPLPSCFTAKVNDCLGINI